MFINHRALIIISFTRAAVKFRPKHCIISIIQMGKLQLRALMIFFFRSVILFQFFKLLVWLTMRVFKLNNLHRDVLVDKSPPTSKQNRRRERGLVISSEGPGAAAGVLTGSPRRRQRTCWHVYTGSVLGANPQGGASRNNTSWKQNKSFTWPVDTGSVHGPQP